jgi:tetratricopeptide (TPR) repeat protein
MSFIVVSLASVIVFACLAYKQISYRRRAMSLAWPMHLSDSATCRYAKYYLKKSGWEILGEWDWFNIRVRAGRKGQQLNLLVPELKVQSLQRALIDADELASKNNILITLLLPQQIDGSADPLPNTPRVLVISAPQLAIADELLHAKRSELDAAEKLRGERGSASLNTEDSSGPTEPLQTKQPTGETFDLTHEALACDRIKEALRNKQFDEAEALANAALMRYNYSQAVWLQYCLVSFEKKDFPEAVRRLESKPEIIAPSAEACRYLAASYRFMKNHSAAEEILERASAEFPGKASLLLERAWNSTQGGDITDARKHWAELRSNYPNHHEAFWVASNLALRQGDIQDAESICEEGYSRFPKNGHMLWQWALSATRRQNWPEAERRWIEARAAYPDMQEIQNGYGQFEFERRIQSASIISRRDDLDSQSSAFHNASSLLLGFESLGSNCEFGMIQRASGVEPLGLLRWANIKPDRLITMLDTEFDGVGDAEFTTVETNSNGEYMMEDKRYFQMHTFVHVGQMTKEGILNQAMIRSRFLARKLREDLNEANKILVYKSHWGGLTNEEIAGLFAAVLRYGPNRLLCVHKVELDKGVTRLRKLGDGLFLAAMPELTEYPQEAKTRFRLWEDICSEVATG